ncbi:ankyrin repeat domain-containing protein [Wolbachia endosymbiont of Cantharis cryptica]|uniref:ankyrin repeat domain-containing protein n=1 Tax=Wolbachia endosymbiont of Cantharis cryptica TaxID=3066132 RepID=UPI00376EAE62
MDLNKWEKILSAISGKSNVIEEIKDELLKEDPETYQKWKRNRFKVDHEFEVSTGELTLLHLAARFGHKGVAESLIEKGAEVDKKDGFFGHTPLDLAAEYGHKEVVKLLLENGANVNEKDGSGNTSLDLAAAFGRKSVGGLLITHDAKVNVKKRIGGATFYIPECTEHNKVAKVLIGKGANVSTAESNTIKVSQNPENTTPSEVRSNRNGTILDAKSIDTLNSMLQKSNAASTPDDRAVDKGQALLFPRSRIEEVETEEAVGKSKWYDNQGKISPK